MVALHSMGSYVIPHQHDVPHSPRFCLALHIVARMFTVSTHDFGHTSILVTVSILSHFVHILDTFKYSHPDKTSDPASTSCVSAVFLIKTLG